VNAAPQKKGGPGKERYQYDRHIKPERLYVLELRSQIPLEIVLDDENPQKIRIAAGAANVPGQGGGTESHHGHRMKEPKRILSPFGQPSPEEHRAATQKNRGRTFGKYRGSHEESKQN